MCRQHGRSSFDGAPDFAHECGETQDRNRHDGAVRRLHCKSRHNDMGTAEVSPRYTARLAKAVLLLAAGAAAHVWLFPSSPRSAKTTAEVTATGAGMVGTSGRSAEQPMVASSMGEFARAEASAAANTVKVIVKTIRPAVIFGLVPDASKPARVAEATDVTPAVPSSLQPEIAPATYEVRAAPAMPPSQVDSREFSVAAMAAEATSPANVRTNVSDTVLPVARERPRTISNSPALPEYPSDERLVSAVLQQYRAAYERLDVGAAQSVWPTVDARALGAAFRQLAGQRVTFDSCGVSVSGSGAQATARCRGQAEYLPKVGSRRAYVASGEWVFDLAKQDMAWRIVNAEATIK